MQTKLTLRLDKDIIEKIKIHASSKHRSLSELTEELYKTELYRKDSSLMVRSPIAGKYKGILGDADTEYEDGRLSRIREKHLG